MFQQLRVVSPLFRQLALQEQVRMRVDQARQKGRRTQINDSTTGRRRVIRTRMDGGDPIVEHLDRDGSLCGGSRPVNQPCRQHHRRRRGQRRLREQDGQRPETRAHHRLAFDGATMGGHSCEAPSNKLTVFSKRRVPSCTPIVWGRPGS